VGDADEGEKLVQLALHVDQAHRESLTDRGQAQLAQLVDQCEVEWLTGVDRAERHLTSLQHEEDPGARRDVGHHRADVPARGNSPARPLSTMRL
jgi:hypothetical protein